MMETENTRAGRLEAADVLLVHTRGSVWGWIIRLGTRCYWNHALMVCRTGNGGQGDRDALVVDARSDGRIVIGPVRRYLDRPGKYDVAVKRLDTGLSRQDDIDLRSHICNVAVGEVEVKLGLPVVEAVDRFIRQLTLVLRFIRRKLGRAYRPPPLPWTIRPVDVKAFTCGGFVQWCYYKAALRMVSERRADGSLTGEVLFNPRAGEKPTPFELLTTTPADLAECDRLAWKYAFRNGVVEDISGVRSVPASPVPA